MFNTVPENFTCLAFPQYVVNMNSEGVGMIVRKFGAIKEHSRTDSYSCSSIISKTTINIQSQ